MATLPTHHEDAPAANVVPKPGPGILPPNLNLLVALLATDWVIGDKHHYAMIRSPALKLLGDLGKDGAEAKARIEGMSGAKPPVDAPTAKAA
jgi:hypothetical protein